MRFEFLFPYDGGHVFLLYEMWASISFDPEEQNLNFMFVVFEVGSCR